LEIATILASLRRDHVLQAIGDVAGLATRHLRPLWLIAASMAYMPAPAVNLDQDNQYA
jgi:hypothetical protein